MQLKRAAGRMSAASAGYVHGLILRGLALIAKFVFLIVVVPGLPDGTYAAYLYLFTIGLVAARFLSLGAEEHLPTLVRDDRSRADAFVPVFVAAFLAAIVCVAVFFWVGHVALLVGALIAQLAAGWVLGGLTRAGAPHLYERLLNGPILAFVAACFVAPPQTIAALLIYYIAANLMFQAATVAFSGALARADYAGAPAALPNLLAVMVPGLAKTISNVLVVLNTRAVIMLPVLMGATVVSDSLALAISIGEAFWQLGMVVAMRNYARYCRGEGTKREMLAAGAALFAAMAVLGVIALSAPIPFSVAKLDWTLVGWSLLLAAGLLVFMEARYFAWAKAGATAAASAPFIAFQCAFLGLQAAIILLAPLEVWLPAMAIAAACFALGYLVVGWVTSRAPDDHAKGNM